MLKFEAELSWLPMSEPPNLPSVPVQYDGGQDLDGEFAAFLENFSPLPADPFDPGRMPSLGLPLDAAGPAFPDVQGVPIFPFPAEGLAQSVQQGSRESVGPNTGSQSRSDNSLGNAPNAAATSRAGEAGPSLDRKTRILEKNRRAQKRFRDKQKNKMAEMEASVQQLEEQLETATAERACLERQHEVLKKVLDLRQTQVDSLSQLAGVGEESFEAATLRCVGPCEKPEHDLEPGLTEDMLRKMANEDAIARWRNYVRSMKALMAQTRHVDANECCEEGKTVRRHAGSFVHRLAIVNPMAVKVLMATNFESGTMDESNAVDSNTVDGEFWARAVEAVDLSASQRQEVLHATSTLLTRLTELRGEREKIANTLEQTLPVFANERRCLSESIHTMRALAELRRSFAEEHNAWTDYIAGVLGRVLTGPQFGAYCMSSYPYFPNTFQLAKHVANTSASLDSSGQDGDGDDRSVVSVIKHFSEQLQLW